MSKWIDEQIHLQKLAKETTGDTERRGINGAQAMWMARDHYINTLEALKKAEKALRTCGWVDCQEHKTFDEDAVYDALTAIEDLGKE